MNKRADGLAEAQKDAASQAEHKTASKKHVLIYIVTLFVVVIFFIVLSYLINDRNSSQIHTLHEKNMTAQEKIENLQSENIRLKTETEEYEVKIKELEQQLEDTENELRQTRINWREDVQAVLSFDREQYSALLEQYNELKENEDIKVDSDD